MSEKTWRDYFELTKGAKPRPILIKAVSLVKEKNEALDLGAGAFNDVRYFLAEGFKHITALDKTPIAESILKNFPKDKIEYVISSFEEFDFGENKYDLINAQYSLPFNPKESFNKVFNSIKTSLKPGGVFVGQFFGNLDEWNILNSNMTFHTKEEAEKLFAGLHIIEFKEENQKGKTATGDFKHWHVFHFIALK